MSNEVPTKANLSAKPVSVDNMHVTDIEECAVIFSDVYQDIYSEPWTIESSKTRLMQIYETDPDFCYVLRVNGAIVGFLLARRFVWFDGTRIWLEEVVIKKGQRGKGLGKMLLSAFFERCKREKISGISLISHKDSVAYQVYKKLNFQSSNWEHLEMDLE